MDKVLTTASQVTCGHGGTVAISSTEKLTVEGSPVLVKTSIQGKAVSSPPPNAPPDEPPAPGVCTTPPSGSSSKPCTTVALVIRGQAGKLTAGGKPVILETLTGATDGVVSSNIAADLGGSAQQNKLLTE